MTRRPKSKPLFADFGLRIVALFIDFIVVLFVATAIKDHVLVPAGLAPGNNWPVMLAVMVFYFAVSWITPLRAPPGQLLTDMRVVTASLETMTVSRAIVRSLALTGLIAGAFLIVDQPANELLALVALTAYVLVFLAAVTPTRADYPDGGYYQLEDDGVVRIHFTVIPDLMKGTIVLSPVTNEDNISWECHSDGEIERNYLPGMCRD